MQGRQGAQGPRAAGEGPRAAARRFASPVHYNVGNQHGNQVATLLSQQGRRQAKGGVIRYHLQFLKWQKPHKDWCTMQYNNG